jgi:hypothetical protein
LSSIVSGGWRYSGDFCNGVFHYSSCRNEIIINDRNDWDIVIEASFCTAGWVEGMKSSLSVTSNWLHGKGSGLGGLIPSCNCKEYECE